jgi:uncharacterized protein
MSPESKLTGKGTAIVTGASSGIGEEFARQLASQGYDLLLIARREERLRILTRELQAQYGVKVDVMAVDLSLPEGIQQVVTAINGCPSLQVLVNNAGFGVIGNFWEIETDRHLDMISVHVLATVVLCRAALTGMIARHQGDIINVSSVAAFMPLGGNVTYNATKAYLVTFTQTLALELREACTCVHVQALCPGFTHTGFHSTPVFQEGDPLTSVPEFMWMAAADVVSQSLKALKHKRVIFIPGFKNRLVVLASRMGIIGMMRGLIRWWYRKHKI